MRILIVEDEADVADLLARALREAAWAPDVARTGARALDMLSASEYDLAVLDLALPDTDGLEVCRRWRSAGGRTPLLILTARQAVTDRIRGLDAGADDYLAKPFVVDELLARLRALARRPRGGLDVRLGFAGLELDTTGRTASRAGRLIPLTAREYALLEYLMRNPRRVLSRTRILDHVWNDNFDPVANAVDVLVGRVRRKVSRPGEVQLIHTVRGMGYQLAEHPPFHAA